MINILIGIIGKLQRSVVSTLAFNEFIRYFHQIGSPTFSTNFCQFEQLKDKTNFLLLIGQKQGNKYLKVFKCIDICEPNNKFFNERKENIIYKSGLWNSNWSTSWVPKSPWLAGVPYCPWIQISCYSVTPVVNLQTFFAYYARMDVFCVTMKW